MRSSRWRKRVGFGQAAGNARKVPNKSLPVGPRSAGLGGKQTSLVSPVMKCPMSTPYQAIRSEELAACAWAESCELIDRQLAPLGLRAIDVLEFLQGEVGIDVCCGTGQTFLQLAERVGSRSEAIGIDRRASLGILIALYDRMKVA